MAHRNLYKFSKAAPPTGMRSAFRQRRRAKATDVAARRLRVQTKSPPELIRGSQERGCARPAFEGAQKNSLKRNHPPECIMHSGKGDFAPELIRGSQGSGCDRPASEGPTKKKRSPYNSVNDIRQNQGTAHDQIAFITRLHAASLRWPSLPGSPPGSSGTFRTHQY